jgi:broad specificity phosphatase PhoE
MHPKKLYFIRHGETEYNRLNIVQGRGVNSPLNETGHWQAEAFFHTYRHIPVEAVIASSLLRTHQTVAPFTQQQLPLTILNDLDEMHWGSFEGKPASPELKEIYQKATQEWSLGNYDFSFGDGESARQLADRLSRALEYLCNRPEDTLLVCSHGRALRCLLCLAKGLPLSEMASFHPKNTGLFVAYFDGSDFHFELENDTQHLTLYARLTQAFQ